MKILWLICQIGAVCSKSSSDVTIAEVAYTLGFEYPNYFAQRFKKKVGITPTQYRNQTH
ncbi:helix-turn-helix domain-containing protein [Candidatus Albibeggiatoa sp. nov. NOAA]|uniref:helix-turn-helix domain-containing protein n=1 Tax=Candidatus Albibeggiatoa sp. nov. NOAA TaxID=3162724 RepID=UPI003342585F